MRVYLDTCVIQRPLDDPSHHRVRLEAEAAVTLIELCMSGAIELVGSAIHVIESEANDSVLHRNQALDVLAVAHVYVETTAAVAVQAAVFERAGIKRLDALHLASAVVSEADFFCTTDDRLLRRGQQVETGALAVVSPLDLILKLP